MYSTSIFACIMEIAWKFIFITLLFFRLIKLIIFIACSLKDSQNLFIKSLPLNTLSFFYMLLNDDIVETQEPDGICSPTFVVNEF